MKHTIDPDFWTGKRVLLTGHSGFKGGWLALWLHKLGAIVTGVALPPPESPNLYEIARIGDNVDSHFVDIRDAEGLQKICKVAAPEVVFHLAAQALVRPSYQSPVDTFATNLMGTVNVLEAIRQVGGVRAAVMITTDKCYENREWVWPYRENEALGGHDPYSASKAAAEIAIAAYRRSFLADRGCAVASARAGNVIGGGDWASDRLLPDILRALDAGETLVLRSPDAIRPWQHVLEPLGGYLQLAQALWHEGESFAQGWNFGPPDDDARSVGWIVDHLATLSPALSWRRADGVQPHEAHTLKLDSSLARSRLHWRNHYRLPAALAMTLDWHQAWRAGRDMANITLEQIERHQDAVAS